MKKNSPVGKIRKELRAAEKGRKAAPYKPMKDNKPNKDGNKNIKY